MTTTFALAKIRTNNVGLDLDAFAKSAGLHPDLIVRYVDLGLLDPQADAAGHWRFPQADLATVARIQRLRAGFGLNYAAVGLVMDLLDRLATRGSTQGGGRAWISTS